MGFKKKFEDTDSPQTPSTKTTGNWGEKVAMEYLIAQGCAIMECQWKSGHYEVDIIAQKGTRVLFVEVKTRKSDAIDPASAVTTAKQNRIIKSADAFLKMYDIPLEYQFDIITVVGTPSDYKIEYIPDAYFPNWR